VKIAVNIRGRNLQKFGTHLGDYDSEAAAVAAVRRYAGLDTD